MEMGGLLSVPLWIGMTVFFSIAMIGISIFFYLLFKRTHVKSEIKAFFTNTPIGIFFQDNKFVEWRPVTPINGVVYDAIYGPFIVTTTYVDKKTKNIIIPFDIDMDGDRTTNIKELVEEFRNITNNEKSIAELRTVIASGDIEMNENIRNVTSYIRYGALKNLFVSSVPHNIKSKIEKIVSERVAKYGKVNAMQAIIVFGAIFGIIIIATILLKTVGGA